VVRDVEGYSSSLGVLAGVVVVVVVMPLLVRDTDFQGAVS